MKWSTEVAVVSTLALSVSALLLEMACNKLPTPEQAGAAVDVACTLLKAFDGTPEEQAICATAADLIELAKTVREKRGDAGLARFATQKTERCQIVETVCATDIELAYAIVAKKAAK